MIGQLLLTARLEHRETPLATEIFALDEILESVCEDAGFEAQTRGIAVNSELVPELNVRGQPALLHSAIENVVRNAVRYTPDHSSVTVRLRKLGADCVIEVEDCGDRKSTRLGTAFVRTCRSRWWP